LEVGTGFHPELTGRENIYLNGAILGMKKTEMDRKFDEIVAFAEIEKFIDTPVKRYSSGMYVRLAFSVAAHLEPEILLVDEVLAVGDVVFQKKCLGKMGDVAREGRTVLFVSHNMVAVARLCRRVIWLHDGRLVEEGQSDQVISKYIQNSFSPLKEQLWDDKVTAPGNDKVRLHRVCVRPEHGSPSDVITMQTPLVIEVEFWNLIPNTDLSITLHLYTEQGIVAFTTGSVDDPSWLGRHLPVGLFRTVCYIPGNLLNGGMHRVLVLVVKDESYVIYSHEDALLFKVIDSQTGAWYGKRPGATHPMLKWKIEQVNGELKSVVQNN
jgi:lipopolysaccharide transport system ATP-binding protein